MGPGGIGKTRLAVEALLNIVEFFPDGIHLIELASVDNAELIVPAIAETLSFDFQGETDPKTEVLNYLRTARSLLLFDNFEHLLDGVDFILELLDAASELTLLITSREALGLQEEWLYPVTGMPVPTDPSQHQLASPQSVVTTSGRPPSVNTQGEMNQPIESYASIQLFSQRARRADTSFALDRSNQTDVIRICELVDGMPLGLELAATWVRMLSCHEIAQELSQSIDFLESTQRNALARHRNLRVVFDQSWRLLTEDEQTVLGRLSLFRGGFTRQAAERVGGATLRHISALTSKSLIRLNQQGRYDIHPLLHLYMREQFVEDSQENDKTSARHSHYYGAFLQSLYHDLIGGKQLEALQQIDADLENIRAGWQHTLNNLTKYAQFIESEFATEYSLEDSIEEFIEQLDRYITILFHFYETRSRFQEGAELFHEARTNLEMNLAPHSSSGHTASTGHIVLGKIFGREGWFLFHLGRHEEAKDLLERSIKVLVQHKARQEQVFSLNYLGALLFHLGILEEAEAHLEKSLTICQEVGDRFGSTVTRNVLGQIAYQQGNYEEARHLYQESLTIKRDLGDRWGMTFSLRYLGIMASAQGEHREARRLFDESLSISQQIGDRRGVAETLSRLGDLAVKEDDLESAEAAYQHSLAVYTEIHHQLGIITTHTKLGTLAYAAGQLDEAWRAFCSTLQIAVNMQVNAVILDTLTYVAQLFLAKGRVDQAAQLLRLIATHPTSSIDGRKLAQQLMAEISLQQPIEPEKLTPDALDEAITEQIRNLLKYR